MTFWMSLILALAFGFGVTVMAAFLFVKVYWWFKHRYGKPGEGYGELMTQTRMERYVDELQTDELNMFTRFEERR